MTTERGRLDDPGMEPGGSGGHDDPLAMDSITATREETLGSTGLSDAPYPQGAGTSTTAPTAESSSFGTAAGRTGAMGSGSSGSAGAAAGAGSGDRLQEAAGGVADRVAGTAQEVATTARQQVGGQVSQQVDSQLSRAGDVLDQVARAVREGGRQVRDQQPQVAGLADTAAEQVDRAARFLHETDMNGLVRETERFARRQPALFLGGALVAGLLAARFLKAGPQSGAGGGSFGQGFDRGYGAGSARRLGGGYGSTTGYGSASTTGRDLGTDTGAGHGRV